MKQKKSLFIISSAIHTRFGVYNEQERIEQTYNTCKSIKEKCDDFDIIILDGGEKQISNKNFDKISKLTIGVYSFAEDLNIKKIQAIQNHDVVKNMIEMYMYGTFFNKLLKEKTHENYKRIFKISGRYVLNDSFDYQTHLDSADKIIIRGPFVSQFPAGLTGGIQFQYMSRLWSFDSNLLDYIAQTYTNMFQQMQQRLNSGGYADIEHLLFANLDINKIRNIGKLGIEGNIAPNGALVSD